MRFLLILRISTEDTPLHPPTASDILHDHNTPQKNTREHHEHAHQQHRMAEETDRIHQEAR